MDPHAASNVEADVPSHEVLLSSCSGDSLTSVLLTDLTAYPCGFLTRHNTAVTPEIRLVSGQARKKKEEGSLVAYFDTEPLSLSQLGNRIRASE